MMHRIACAFLLALPCLAQTGPRVGEWRAYTDKEVVRRIATTGDEILCATAGGPFVYRTAAVDILAALPIDRMPTLDDRCVEVDSAGTAYYGGSDGSITLVTAAGAVSSVLDIARATDKPMRGINALRMHGGLLYCAADYGVSVYDPARKEFRDTYTKFGSFPSLTNAVSDILFTGDSIWVATDAGVATASLTTANLQDPANWRSFSAAEFGADHAYCLASYLGIVMTGTEKGVVRYDGGQWQPTFGAIAEPVRRLVTAGTVLYAVSERQVRRITSLIDVAPFGDYAGPPAYSARLRFNDLLVRPDGSVAVATDLGLAIYRPNEPWNPEHPTGPPSNAVTGFSVDRNGILWAGSSDAGFGSFDGTTWTIYSTLTRTDVPTDACTTPYSSPSGVQYIATFGRGVLYGKPDGSFGVYNATTVPNFPQNDPDNFFAPVTGVCADRGGNLWILNRESRDGRVLSCLAQDGTWYYFTPPVSGLTYGKSLVVDDNGDTWFVDEYGSKGIVRFDDRGTLANPFDDVWTRYAASDAEGIDAEDATSIALDSYGDLWIGASAGIRTIFSPQISDRVTKTCYNTRCNIEGQYVTCVAVDPVNNKWLGTTAGIVVLSSDGSTIVAQYDRGNSPLLSNRILAIAVHPGTGVAYISTDRGICALGTAYAQAASSGGTLRAYPNPFRPGRDTRVQIDGLPEASTVKILTLSGRLVREFATPGGRIAFWDGTAESGAPAASGIYLIVGYGADGTSVATGKLAVVRK